MLSVLGHQGLIVLCFATALAFAVPHQLAIESALNATDGTNQSTQLGQISRERYPINIRVPDSNVVIGIALGEESLDLKQMEVLLALAYEDAELGKQTYGEDSRLPGPRAAFDKSLPVGLAIHAQAIQGRQLTWGIAAYAMEGLLIFEHDLHSAQAFRFEIISSAVPVGRGTLKLSERGQENKQQKPRELEKA